MNIAGTTAGQIKMKGKKEKDLSFLCCTLYNHKDDLETAIFRKELKEYLSDGPALDSTDN